MSDNSYFYCYSIKLKDWLKLNGLQYKQRLKHNNGNYFWIFQRDDALDKALTDWDRYKKIFN